MSYKTDFLGHIKFCIWDRAVTAVHLFDCDERHKEIEDMKYRARKMLEMTLKNGARRSKTNDLVTYRLGFILEQVERYISFFGNMLFEEGGKNYMTHIKMFKEVLHNILLNFSSYEFWYQKAKA